MNFGKIRCFLIVKAVHFSFATTSNSDWLDILNMLKRENLFCWINWKTGKLAVLCSGELTGKLTKRIILFKDSSTTKNHIFGKHLTSFFPQKTKIFSFFLKKQYYLFAELMELLRRSFKIDCFVSSLCWSFKASCPMQKLSWNSQANFIQNDLHSISGFHWALII